MSEAMRDGMEQDEEQIKLGRRIREAREYLGLSQEFVADQLAIPRPSVSAMETGKRKVGSLELKELARLLKRPVSYFLGEDDHEVESEETFRVLYRTARALSEQDREQVLKFAQFLRRAGKVPSRETK